MKSLIMPGRTTSVRAECMMGTKMMTKLKSKLKSGLSPTVQCQWYVIMFPALVVKPNRVHQLFSRCVLAYLRTFFSSTQTPVQVWRKTTFSAVTKKRDICFSHKVSMIGRYTVPTLLLLLRTFSRAFLPLGGQTSPRGAREGARGWGGHVILKWLAKKISGTP
jgi:hypothetical protein